MKYIKILLVCFILALCWSVLPAKAFLSPHPIQMYEQGEKILRESDGNIKDLLSAKDVFVRLILKYPNSPFGYLGMSHIYRIDAQLGKEGYDMQIIRERALPFALQAMKLGPSIRAVHENYAFFEKFFKQGDATSLNLFSQ